MVPQSVSMMAGHIMTTRAIGKEGEAILSIVACLPARLCIYVRAAPRLQRVK